MDRIMPAAPGSIRMGEMSVAMRGGLLRTLLGSCVGLALHDRCQQVGGLAHIVLPMHREEPTGPESSPTPRFPR